MVIFHLKQGKNNCGQTCLAMLSGESIEFVSTEIGRKGGTRGKDYIDYLENCGFEIVNKKFKILKKGESLPKLCIVKGHNIPKTSYTHVIVHYDGAIYNPSWPDESCLDNYLLGSKNHFKMTSYMELKDLFNE